jgi:flagellar basal-body rod protein FlgB
MDQISALLITKALDGLAMRASAISQNISNANSPGYLPVRVSFEDQLRGAAGAGPDAVRAVQPQFVRVLAEDVDAELRIDLEMASASETALRYSALVDVLSRQMQISRLAVRGGQ